MEFVGRRATEAEKQDMLSPYCKNSGKEWTLEEIRDCVNRGAERVAANPQISGEIERGLKMLKASSAGKQV